MKRIIIISLLVSLGWISKVNGSPTCPQLVKEQIGGVSQLNQFLESHSLVVITKLNEMRLSEEATVTFTNSRLTRFIKDRTQREQTTISLLAKIRELRTTTVCGSYYQRRIREVPSYD